MLKFFHKFLHRLHGPKQLVTARLQSEMVWSFQTAILPPDCLLHRKFVCLQLAVVQTPAKLGKNEKIESGWCCLMPLTCFVLLAPVSQRIFGKSLTCTVLMRPAPVSFWKAGHVCLVWPKILVTRQRLGLSHLRAVLFTPLSGSISQQHCITLTGFPHLTERNLIRFLPPQPTKASHTLMPQLFFRPLYSFLPHLCCILCFGSIGTAKIKLRRGLFCLSGQKPLKGLCSCLKTRIV